VAAVARKLRDLALSGDVPAAKVLLSHIVGKPSEARDPDHLDVEEFELLDRGPTKSRALAVMLDAVDPGTAASIVRQFIPTDVTDVRDRIIATGERAAETVIEERQARRRRPPRA
jgi:hypothetical protein